MPYIRKKRKSGNRTYLRADGSIDYKKGIQYSVGRPRGYQPREGGPPLLFATDMRMTILVTLALAETPMRPIDLWKHIGRKYPGCVADMDKRGLVCAWKVAWQEAYIALNPMHPAAGHLKNLLLDIGRVYQFAVPAPSGSFAEVPNRLWLETNSQFTFGDHIRTLVLLLVYVLGHAPIFRIARCLPKIDRGTVSQIVWMYAAFGILQSKPGKKTTFSLNREHVLNENLTSILTTLDQAMPQWRMVAEIQDCSNTLPRHETRTGRNPNRWKW